MPGPVADHVMKMRGIPLLLSICLSWSALGAQNKDEIKFLQTQAKYLDKYARFTFDQGFPLQARRIWQEVMRVYDADHPATRQALGYRRANDAWLYDPKVEFPGHDNPDRRALKKVEALWKKTAKKVGGGHRKIGETFQQAGRRDRASWHFTRALRFLPGDPDIRAKSGLKSFYGLVGSELESQLYENSKAMTEFVTAELKKPYKVEVLASSKQSVYLTKAGIPHVGYKTDNYTIWTNWEAAFIEEVAQNVERSRAFCARFLKGNPGFRPVDLRINTLIFLKGEKLYKQTLQANKDLFRPELLEFLLEHTGMCDIGKGAERAQISGDANDRVVMDLSIRYPVDEWAGMRCDAFNEGVGHAVVALFLGRIDVFTLDMETKAHTVTAGAKVRVRTPDIESWQDLAIESAFEARGTPIAKLPLISAADFPADARIRAWSFSDYILRRDPRLLQELDAVRKSKSPPEVKSKFHQSTGIQLDALEQEWRDFWTGASPVLRALRGRKPPFDASSRDAAKWLTAFNKARKSYQPRRGKAVKPLTWNLAWSLLCKQHGTYLATNRSQRGAVAEQTEVEGLKGATKKGEYFAQMALVSTQGSPAKVLKDWIHLPGYRDALLNPYMTQVGLYAESGIAVIDVLRGAVAPRTAQMRVYPLPQSTGVPNSIELEQLGPSVAKLLELEQAEGKIGYPITLHTWHGGGGAQATCDVTANGRKVEGVVQAGGAFNRRVSAPGLLVFYPREPLPKGAKIEVLWVLSPTRSQRWHFTTR